MILHHLLMILKKILKSKMSWRSLIKSLKNLTNKLKTKKNAPKRKKSNKILLHKKINR